VVIWQSIQGYVVYDKLLAYIEGARKSLAFATANKHLASLGGGMVSIERMRRRNFRTKTKVKKKKNRLIESKREDETECYIRDLPDSRDEKEERRKIESIREK
jgi:hypothetical protein